MKFLLQATTLSVLAASISFATDSSAQLCMLMAFLIAVFHGLLADSIRYRRLVHRHPHYPDLHHRHDHG